jgi:hypothetical protein
LTAGSKLREAPSYPWKNEKQRQIALETLKELRTLARRLDEGGMPLAFGAPHPRPELRPRPQI